MEGAKEGLEALRNANKPLAFVSNNSFLSRKVYEDNFSQLVDDFDYTKDLIHPAEATAIYLRQRNFTGLVYVMASASFREVLEAAGFNCYSLPTTTSFTSLHEIMSLIREVPTISAVVYDVDLNFNLLKFYAAQHFLASSPECLLIYGANDKTFKYRENVYAGVGLFMEALAGQVAQEPVILGKPSAILGAMVMEKFKISDPSRVLFIGDSLTQDIGFANSMGFQSLLVLSGATSREMLLKDNAVNGESPNYIADGLHDLVSLFDAK